MIRPLRERHRRMMLGLLLLAPAGFLLGLRARPDEPVMTELPAQILHPSTATDTQGIVLKNEWPRLPISTVLFPSKSGLEFTVELHAERDLLAPSILIYWSRDAAEYGGRLPEKSFLLGSMSGRGSGRLYLPPEAKGMPGFLILYSLIDQSVLDASLLPPASGVTQGSRP